MKPTTQNISATLKNPELLENFNQTKARNPNFTFQETSITEAYDEFVKASELLQRTIDNNLFDFITFTKRSQIWSTVSSIFNHVNQLKQFGFDTIGNGNAINTANSLIQLVLSLVDFIEGSNLYAKSIGLEDYKEEVKRLSEIRKKYQDLITQLNEAEKIKNSASDIFNNLTVVNQQLNDALTEANNKVTNITNYESSGTEVLKKINDSGNAVKENEKEIESKKLQVNAFAENIEEYKKAITKLQEDAKILLSKETEINVLINQAEKALNLKSAEGISAAFSSHYHDTNSKNTLQNWIIGSIIFIVAALGLTIWIVSSASVELNSIIGRIVAVGIAITGATFCSKQYVKQKNIIEDYAYKSVLAKSIVAFTEEIKKRDDKKVAEYLSKVLEEIHMDPLRERNNRSDKLNSIYPTKLIEKLIDKLPKVGS